MNLVAHYYLDRQLVNSFFTVGAATPDLLSIYNSGLRVKTRHLRQLTEAQFDQIPHSFIEGLQRHFFADGIFHTSPLFHTSTKRISNMLVSYFPDLKIERKFFVGHILLELLLDKVLIQRHPGILESYYNHFEALQPFASVKSALEVTIGQEITNYDEYLARFLERKFLYHYANYEHIAWILARILQRVRIRDVSYVHSQPFLQLMTDFEAELTEYHEDFFTEIRAAAAK